MEIVQTTAFSTLRPIINSSILDEDMIKVAEKVEKEYDLKRDERVWDDVMTRHLALQANTDKSQMVSLTASF